jgi:glycosyltransferase involved in cell wall biosynthesis
MGAQLLRELPAAGVSVDAYFAGARDEIPEELCHREGLSLNSCDLGWRYGRWYSRNPLATFATGQITRAVAQNRLVGQIVRNHERSPYHALYQFSQLELFAIRRLRRALPPIVVHPEVHAAGELRWHTRERDFALRGESTLHYGFVRTLLKTRARAQRRDLRHVDLVIAPSHVFGRELVDDYGVAAGKVRSVPNPVDLERFHPAEEEHRSGDPIGLLFVSRISVRKGVELIVELSHRLSDLDGAIKLIVVGGQTLWSDYRALLADLNPRTGEYRGAVHPDVLPDLYRSADILLQPSHYEPFALTVAEALASGVPVVASDAVGASEEIDRSCCRTFPAGDMEAFEAEVRGLIADLQRGGGPEIRQLARKEAEHRFNPLSVARGVADVLNAAAEPT